MNHSTAPEPHPSREAGDQDLHLDQDERPHICNDGWVTLGQIVLDPETGEAAEEYAFYLCLRCAKRLGRMK
jgi:hypothetical protein